LYVADALCRSEIDTIWSIEWPAVPVGSVATQRCPGQDATSGGLLWKFNGHFLDKFVNFDIFSMI